MIFENVTKSILGFFMLNQLRRNLVYSNYNNFANLETMKITVLKLTIILPIIALISEIIVFIKNYNVKEFNHKRLKKRKCRVVDQEQIRFSLVFNGLFILLILIFYILNKPEESGQLSFYILLMNFIVLNLYVIFNSFNNIKFRNGIYMNGIYSMGESYKWNKINDIKVMKDKKEIHIVRKIVFLGNITRKIKYNNEEVAEYVEEIISS